MAANVHVLFGRVLLFALYFNSVLAAVVTNICSTSDVGIIKAKVTHDVYFCTFYTARGRALSPIKNVSKDRVYRACQCIVAESRPAAKPSVLPAPTGKGFGPQGNCFSSDIRVLEKEFADPTSFCNFYSAWSAEHDPSTPVASLTGPRTYNACQCFLEKIPIPVSTIKSTTTPVSQPTSKTSAKSPMMTILRTTAKTTPKSTGPRSATKSMSETSTASTSTTRPNPASTTSKSASTTSKSASTTSAFATTPSSSPTTTTSNFLTTAPFTTSTTIIPTTTLPPSCTMTNVPQNVTYAATNTEVLDAFAIGTFTQSFLGYGSTMALTGFQSSTSFNTAVPPSAVISACASLLVKEQWTSHNNGYNVLQYEDRWDCIIYWDQYDPSDYNNGLAEDDEVMCSYFYMETNIEDDVVTATTNLVQSTSTSLV